MKKNLTIRQILLPIMIFAAGIPIALFAMISQERMRNSINKSAEMQISNDMIRANESLNIVLDKYDTMLFELCTDNEMIKIIDGINQGEDTLDVWKNAIENELCHMCNSEGPIKGITILTSKKKIIYYDELSGSAATTLWADEMSFPRMNKEVYYRGVTEPVGEEGKQKYIFQIIRDFVDYRGIYDDIGTVIFSIEISALDTVLKVGDTNTSIVENGKIIADLDRSKIGTIPNVKNTDDYRFTKIINSKSGFTILNTHSMKIYNEMMTEQMGFWIIIAICTIYILITLSYFMTKPYLNQIDQLALAMSEVEKGNFQVMIPEMEPNALELRKIYFGFNQMVKQIDHLINKVKSAVVDQKNAELSALEAQIDPHFLYNTLDTINWKAIELEQYDISEMVGALADILRYTVRNAGGETTIREEIHWMQQYILLQKGKFEKEPEISIVVPENLYECRIHKLLLQPFIENAMKHGFRGKAGELKLTLMMKEISEQIHITIQDNGNGMEEDELKVLNDRQIQSYLGQGGEHLGIVNVRRRLQLYYGDKADLYFESQVGSYTKVHLFIPVNDYEKTEE